MFNRLGRCFPLVFSLTLALAAQTRHVPDRHAVVNLDAVARASAPAHRVAALVHPIHVPVPESGVAQTGFPALLDQYVSTPPDVQGAVGRNDVVSMVNSEVLIQSRSGTARANYPVELQQFWGTLDKFDKLFDPRLLYDAANDRWIASAGANPNAANAALLLAVSQTGDPGGGWNLFEIQLGADGYWGDYPVLGFSRDWIVLSANVFRLPPNGGYVDTAVYAFDKSTIYKTGSARYTTFHDSMGELAPVVDVDESSTTLYFAQAFAGSGSGSIRISTLSGPVGGETFTAGAVRIAMPEGWSVSSPGEGDFAPQSGSWLKVDTGDSRLQNCVLRGGTAWCTHTVFLPAAAPTRSSIQWFAADPGAGRLLQYGRLDDPAAVKFYAFPSLAVNRAGDVLIGYTRFTAADYPSAGFAFRAASDAAGTLRTGGVVKAGEAPYTGRGADESSNRWGDFSATVVDPLDDGTFWTIQEYAASPTDHYPGRWGTWWAAVPVGRR